MAASVVHFIASQAHLSFPLVHGSNSSFLGGVYMVGHMADLRAKELGVSADEAGTEIMYGAGRERSWLEVCIGTGNDGGSMVSVLAIQMRKVVESFCLRMRLR